MIITFRIIFLEVFHCIYLIAILVIYPLILLIAFIKKFNKVLRNIFTTKDISGQVAVVTGSGRGLGREIAKNLAARKCNIAIVDIQEKLALETAQYLAKTFHVKTKAYKIDVRNYAELLQLRESVTKDLGVPTILINNAGIIAGSTLTNPSPQEIKQMIDVNFTALCYTIQIFLPKMKELNQGYIVNIGSIAGLFPIPLFDIYSATKAAIHSMSKSLRIECLIERKNITVTTVMPAFLNTNKRIINAFNTTDMHYFLPLVEGDIMAKYVIDAMLSGSRDITAPYAFLYVHKLMELLPAFAKELILAAALFVKYNDTIKSKRIAKILTNSDLKDN